MRIRGSMRNLHTLLEKEKKNVDKKLSVFCGLILK